MLEDMTDQKNKHVLDALNTVSCLKDSLSQVNELLAKIEQPVQKIGCELSGYAVMNAKMQKIITVSTKHTLERTVEEIVADMETYPNEYVEGELSDKLNLWQEICHVMHSEEYFYENEFLFNLTKQFINETEVTIYTEFSDVSDRQKSFGETIFSIIEEHRENLEDYEKAIIWGLENDYDGNDWFFSDEEHDAELNWNDDFIDNHLYSMIIYKAQAINGAH